MFHPYITLNQEIELTTQINNTQQFFLHMLQIDVEQPKHSVSFKGT